MSKQDNNNNHNKEENFAKLLKEKEQDSKLDASIKEIYQNGNDDNNSDKSSVSGEPTQPSSVFHRKQADPWKKITVMFLVLLGMITIVSWFLFFLFNSGARMRTEDIEFNIIGPEEVVAGEEVVYELQYKNLSKFNLRDVQINLMYPEGFVVLDAAPVTAGGDNNPALASWQLEQIDIKRSGRIVVKAIIIAPLESEQAIKAFITYRPENFSSTFDVEKEITTKVSSTGVNLNVEAPSFFHVNEESEIKLEYTKQKESFFDYFKIRLEHDDNFVISNSQTGEWEINDLTEQKQELIIKGKYKKKPQTDNLRLVFFIPQEIELDGKMSVTEHIFAEYDLSAAVAEGALQLSLSVNGSLGNKAVDLGDALNYVLHYKNNSDASLKNVAIMATVDSVMVDWDDLVDNNKGERRGNSIIWTKEEVNSLSNISPDEESSFSFSLKVKTAEEAKKIATADFNIISSLDYSIDSKLKDNGQSVTRVVNKVNSDLAFKNEVRYFDRNNIAVGEGPLPPKVGEQTKFKVFWTLTNSRHDLKNITTSVKLPANVNWESNYSNSAGKILYDSNSREISWAINEWDVIDEPAIAEFSIIFTPTDVDKNKIVSLLNPANVSAEDTVSAGIISLSTKAKTTNLEDDEVGKGYGKVE
ncbi:MAG: hypothetical protein ABIH48_02705 [Candidatus Falkowbacteria bacterium]